MSPRDERWMREVVVAFLGRPHTNRVQIATDLGVGEGLGDVSGRDLSREILRRVKASGKVADLAAILDVPEPAPSAGTDTPPEPSGDVDKPGNPYTGDEAGSGMAEWWSRQHKRAGWNEGYAAALAAAVQPPTADTPEPSGLGLYLTPGGTLWLNGEVVARVLPRDTDGSVIEDIREALAAAVQPPTAQEGARVGDRVQRISDGTLGTVVSMALDVEWDYGILGSAEADEVRLVSGEDPQGDERGGR